MGESDIFASLGGGSDRHASCGVPLEAGEPVGQSFPCVIWDGVWWLLVPDVNNRMVELGRANIGRVMDDGVATWSKLGMFASPGVIGVRISDVDQRGVPVPVCVLGFFGVA